MGSVALAKAFSKGFGASPTVVSDGKRKLTEFLDEKTAVDLNDLIKSVVNDSYDDTVTWLDSSDIGLDKSLKIQLAYNVYSRAFPGFDPRISGLQTQNTVGSSMNRARILQVQW